MTVSRETVRAIAAAQGFRPDTVEKVCRLLDFVAELGAHPYLRDRLALKGGTALNVFLFDLPRLSVDVDLNYIGSADREAMLAERPKVLEAVEAVARRLALTIRRAPSEHAGGKYHLRYQDVSGGGGNLDIDLNFMLRVPLWTPERRSSIALGPHRAEGVLMLDVHELAAGKLAALLSRRAARDLFDAHRLLTVGGLDGRRLRTAFVVYGAMSRVDWRQVTPDAVGFDQREIVETLVPVLRAGELRDSLRSGGAAGLVAETRAALSAVLPIEPGEREFLDRILDAGLIEPEHLEVDDDLADRIRNHPMLAWKALNVREHRAGRTRPGVRASANPATSSRAARRGADAENSKKAKRPGTKTEKEPLRRRLTG
ncbi:MAG: nucleotidyl transferase AbiEii/AbiGii toxin family protein [Acidobacteria bacterium]|nr:nucleotidyl transferase AbiEii/AbiGii toxin family protein [Acidobacteriota bacterium]